MKDYFFLVLGGCLALGFSDVLFGFFSASKRISLKRFSLSILERCIECIPFKRLEKPV